MLRKNKKHLSKHRLTLNLGALGTRRQASRAWRILLRNNQDHSILCAVSEAVLHSSKKFIAPGRYRIYTVSTAVCQQKSIYRPLFAIAEPFIELIMLYKKHYEPLLPPGDASLSYTYLNTVLEYCSVHVTTVFETNINILSKMLAYANCAWQKTFLIDRVRKSKTIKQGCDIGVKHIWIKNTRQVGATKQNLVFHGIQCKPQTIGVEGWKWQRQWMRLARSFGLLYEDFSDSQTHHSEHSHSRSFVTHRRMVAYSIH